MEERPRSTAKVEVEDPDLRTAKVEVGDHRKRKATKEVGEPSQRTAKVEVGEHGQRKSKEEVGEPSQRQAEEEIVEHGQRAAKEEVGEQCQRKAKAEGLVEVDRGRPSAKKRPFAVKSAPAVRVKVDADVELVEPSMALGVEPMEEATAQALERIACKSE